MIFKKTYHEVECFMIFFAYLDFWLITNLFLTYELIFIYPFFPGKTDKIAKSMFDEAATDVENELVQTSNSGMTYFAEQKFGRLEHKMDHLACFGGMYI